MLFNLINALMIFQIYINHALWDLVDDFYIIYFDNILIFLKFKKKHYQYLELVIKHLQHAELYTNFKKCEFFKKEVEYLDFLVNKNDLYMNFFYIKIISDWCSHLSKIFYNIQIFIKFYNFYWQFIFNFADIVQLFHLLLCDMKKDRKLNLITDE